jgi:fucose permease
MPHMVGSMVGSALIKMKLEKSKVEKFFSSIARLTPTRKIKEVKEKEV